MDPLQATKLPWQRLNLGSLSARQAPTYSTFLSSLRNDLLIFRLAPFKDDLKSEVTADPGSISSILYGPPCSARSNPECRAKE